MTNKSHEPKVHKTPRLSQLPPRRYRVPPFHRNAIHGKLCGFKDCGARINHMERHVLQHLPIMFSDHDVRHQLKSYLFYFEQMVNVFNVKDSDGLLNHITSEKLFPKQDYMVHPEELEVLREFQEVLDTKYQTNYATRDFKISPPSVPAFAIHWKIQRHLLNSLSDTNVLFLSSINLGNLNNNDPFNSKVRMRILSYNRLKTNLKEPAEKVRESTPKQSVVIEKKRSKENMTITIDNTQVESEVGMSSNSEVESSSKPDIEIPSTPNVEISSKPEAFDTHFHPDLLKERLRLTEYKFSQMIDESNCRLVGGIAIFCFPRSFPNIHESRELLADSRIHCAFGIHPKNADEVTPAILDDLEWYLKTNRVVALGEIGLDYSSKYCPRRSVQKQLFKSLLEMGEKLRLPIIIHCRDAFDDLFEILKSHVHRFTPIHFHCFVGSLEQYHQLIHSFPCSYFGITSKIESAEIRYKKTLLQSMLKHSRLLLETDSPHLKPSHVRYGPNTPDKIISTAQYVATSVGQPLEYILKASTANARVFYKV